MEVACLIFMVLVYFAFRAKNETPDAARERKARKRFWMSTTPSRTVRAAAAQDTQNDILKAIEDLKPDR
jgi:hypothetical protein